PLNNEHTPVTVSGNTPPMPLAIHIQSRHPLAAKAIGEAVMSDPKLRQALRPFSEELPLGDANRQHILVLDTLSLIRWEHVLRFWQSRGYSCVAVVSPQNKAEQFKGIYLGVSNIVEVSDDFKSNLPRAIHAAATGGAWMCRAALVEYIKEANSLLRQLSIPNRRFTRREGQIVHLLLAAYTNKEIGSALNISERTVKFHVSNILQKTQVANRKQLVLQIQC